jgi:hypothetical protein
MFFAMLAGTPARAQDVFDIFDFDETEEGPWSDIDNTTLVVPMVPNGSITLDGQPSAAEYGGFVGQSVVPGENAWILGFAENKNWEGPDDSSFTFWLAHDTEFLYVGVEAKDDIVQSDDPNPTFWKDDAIEIIVDANNDRANVNTDQADQFFNNYGGHNYVNYEGRFSRWDEDFDERLVGWANEDDWSWGPDGEIWGVGNETADGWRMETKFHKSQFEDPDTGNKLVPGYKMGFNIGMDDDDGANLEIQYWWANRLRPELFDALALEAGDTVEDYLPMDDWIIDATGRLTHGGTGEIIFGEMGGVDIKPRLRAGDADQDLDFDQLDLVQVQIAAKYLTGQPATWGEGDWDGAPGGQQGSPPAGDGQFSQLDIIAALGDGNYLQGPYAAIGTGGQRDDGQTSIGYDPATGEVFVDAPAGVELTSVNIDSGAGIFTGAAAQNLGGSFDNDADTNIFKATFGGSFGSISFGNVAQTGLAEDFVLGDLTVVGSLSGGGSLGDVDLIYVPEPSAALLGLLALTLIAVARGRK